MDEARAALAAAEIVAAKLGKPAPDFPAVLFSALSCITLTATSQKTACKAVKQVMKESELQKLWAESDEIKDWFVAQTNLLERLK